MNEFVLYLDLFYGLPFLENLIQLSGLGTDFKNLMALLSEILSATIELGEYLLGKLFCYLEF